uniref:Uncharacterized protein n=1 Tax=Arundo donax TaxID=35708 RepID=A0A0A8YPL3_ARUDO
MSSFSCCCSMLFSGGNSTSLDAAKLGEDVVLLVPMPPSFGG